jgi:hypothetical protein
MKKIIISLSLLFSFTTQAEVMLRTSPLLMLIGANNGEVDVKVTDNISIGLGGLAWSAEVLDVEFSLTEVHGRMDYWFSGTFQQGWYGNVSYSSMSMDLKTTDIFGKDYEGDISGTGIILGVGYHWQWETFHMELGYQQSSYDFDSKLELTSSDGATEEESIPTTNSGGLEFNIGWVF